MPDHIQRDLYTRLQQRGATTMTYTLYTVHPWGEPDRRLATYDDYELAIDTATEEANEREDVILVTSDSGDFWLIGPGYDEED